MDGHIGGGVEAQEYGTAFNAKHRDLEKALKAIGAADHNRLLAFAR
jgi:hypothetical protein